jgi:hypothetical protein
MNGATSPIVLKVNDQYWLDYADTIIKSGLEKRDKAAATIQAFAIWLWGIYTATAAVGFVLAGKDLALGPTIVIALGSVSLIAVYCGTIWVQMPVPVPFDPRSPDDIERVYATNVARKDTRLHVTLLLSIVAAFMISAALVAASIARPYKSVVPKFSAALTTLGGERVLSITGYVNKAKRTTIQVSAISSGVAQAQAQTGAYTPTEDGLIQTSMQLSSNTKEALVSLEWEDADGMSTRLTRKVSEEKQKEQKAPEEQKSPQRKPEDSKSK